MPNESDLWLRMQGRRGGGRNAPDDELTPDETVEVAARRSPRALAALRELGIDTCCGGSLTLAQAAAAAGVPHRARASGPRRPCRRHEPGTPGRVAGVLARGAGRARGHPRGARAVRADHGGRRCAPAGRRAGPPGALRAGAALRRPRSPRASRTGRNAAPRTTGRVWFFTATAADRTDPARGRPAATAASSAEKPPPARVHRRRAAGRPGPRAAAPDGARPGGGRERSRPASASRSCTTGGRSSCTRSSRSAAAGTRPMSRAAGLVRIAIWRDRPRHMISLAPSGRAGLVGDAAPRLPGEPPRPLSRSPPSLSRASGRSWRATTTTRGSWRSPTSSRWAGSPWPSLARLTSSCPW